MIGMMTPEQRRATLDVLKEVEAERIAQHLKWGEQNHPSFDPNADEAEARDMSDAARAECEEAFAQGRGTYCHILTEEFGEALAECKNEAALRVELVQIAAVAVAWIEKIDRDAKS